MLPKEVTEYLKGKRVLVTGGTGMIGRQVTKLCCDAGANVTTVSLDHDGIDTRAYHIYGDLTNLSVCNEVTAYKDCVFHLAGMKGSIAATHERPVNYFVPMLMFNTDVLEACRVNKVKKVVYTSSIGAYQEKAGDLQEVFGYLGEPMDFYAGMAKRVAEWQIHAYRLQYKLTNFAIVRLTNSYGPGDVITPDSMVVTALMGRLMAGENPLTVWGDGTAVRDFLFSRDAAEGIIRALYYGTNEPPCFVNLGFGTGYSVKELVEALHSFIPFDYKFDPSKPSGVARRVMNISLAKKTLEWEPSTPLVDGLKETWESYQRR